MSTQSNDLRDSGGWYNCSQAYLHLRFGVDVWEHPYGIGDCVVSFEEACRCYLDGHFLHPIAHGELVWAITAALGRIFDTGIPTGEQLSLATRVALDAQHRPWAISAIDSTANFNEQVNPGDDRVDRWLRSLDELDFQAMRRRYDEYFRNNPHDELKANALIVGPYDVHSNKQD